MKKILSVMAVALLLVGCASKTEAEKFADELLGKMTLREKLGQMSQFVPQKGIVTGPEGIKIDLNELIKAGEIGSMLNFKTPEEIERMQRLAVDSSRLGIPILFGHDIIHGCKVIFPINLACACTFNEEDIRKSAQIAAYEAAAMGIAWTFSPMCDVSADPRWGRVSEGSGEDPYLGAKISAAMVQGYQGADLADSSTILACVKHFLAYGAPEAGREYNTIDMSQRMFRDRYLPPYKMALEAGASTTRPVRELKGFKRVNLKAGESTEIEFVITPEDMAFCREDMKFAQESGDFKIWVGNTSQATLEGKFTVK